MVVPFTSDTACGAAAAVHRVVSTDRSETRAFAVVVLEENNPKCLEEIAVPHEIGHLLYAEHQTDDNGDELLPDRRNHAIRSASGLVSLMWDRHMEDDSTTYLSGSRADMTSARANNVAFMSEESFDVVSRYRAAPGPTSAWALFLGCHQPGCALWRFEFSADNAQTYRIQSSPYASGPWSTWAVTSSNTYFPHLAQKRLLEHTGNTPSADLELANYEQGIVWPPG